MATRTPPTVPGVGASGGAPAGAPRSDRPFVTFTDVTAGSGLDSFRLHAGAVGAKNWVVETTGGGVILFDTDGDGDLDVCLVDGADMDVRGEIVVPDGSGTRLYRNDGGLRFTDVTSASGAGVRGYGLGGAAADYDGDGDVDLCVTGYDLLHLLRNRGDGTFEDVTAAAGIVPRKWDVSSACSWADVNGDGLLDLFVTNYVDQRWLVERVRKNRGGVARSCRAPFGRITYCGPTGLPGQPNRLLLQRPDRTFEDVSATHVRAEPRPSFQAVFTDVDDDGDLDAFVTNDGADNELLVNDGTGRFADRALEAGCATDADAHAQGSMGAAVADFDHDGRVDLAATNLVREYNVLYRNVTRPGGCLRFEVVSQATHFAAVPQSRVCWGIGLHDFDGDSELDVWTVAGHVYADSELEGAVPERERQCPEIRRNLGAPGHLWEDVSDRAGPHFRDARGWRGAAFGDLDGDGDLDVVASAQASPPAVVRNDWISSSSSSGVPRGGWVRFDLRGRTGTPAGARVTVTLPDGTTRTGEVHCGSSYAGSDDPRVTIGVGDVDVLPRVEVRWPGERTASLVLEDVKTRTTHVVRQP